jgi:hypothetical protein
LRYFNPHSFRKTLALYGLKHCPDHEALKAWSQNLGHADMLTTLNSYGNIPGERQAEILGRLRLDLARPGGADPDPQTVRKVIEHLTRRASTL